MRRDKRGRRIGRNLWREYVTEAYQLARILWEERLEAFAAGYATEEKEFRLLYPAPTFKAFLIALKGTWTCPA